MPALGLLPLDCSSRRQKGSRTFIFVVGVIPFVALDTTEGCVGKEESPTAARGGATPMQAKWIKLDLLVVIVTVFEIYHVV